MGRSPTNNTYVKSYVGARGPYMLYNVLGPPALTLSNDIGPPAQYLLVRGLRPLTRNVCNVIGARGPYNSYSWLVIYSRNGARGPITRPNGLLVIEGPGALL